MIFHLGAADPGAQFALAFWPQFIASIVGALVGGGIAALVAWRVFRNERVARETESERVAANHMNERDQRQVARMFELMDGLFQALPVEEGPNAAVWAGNRFAQAGSALALGMPDGPHDSFYAWLNAFVIRYTELVSNVRVGRATPEAFGDFLTVTSSRLEHWVRRKSTTEEWLLSDSDFRQKHPDAFVQVTHPDHPRFK